jgi:hypothetical protein
LENPDIICRPLMQQEYPIFSDLRDFSSGLGAAASFFS